MRLALLTVALLPLALMAGPVTAASPRGRSLSPRLRDAIDYGRAPAAERHRVVVGLDLRNRATLEAFLAEVQDPGSPRYQQFLTQDEFNALYAPAPETEEAVVEHLRRGGLRITDRSPNRLLVGAVGSVAALERTFGVEIHTMDLGGRRRFAATAEPSLPADLADAVVGVLGLDDLSERRPHLRAMPAAAPHAALGANCCSLSPNDLFTFYDGSPSFVGSGQTIVVAGAYAWQDADNTTFNTQWALPQLPAGSGQVCTGRLNATACRFNSQQSIEIALDVEYAHGVAPGARILNYMAGSTSFPDFTTMYNRIVTDNPGRVVTTSWGACEAGVSSATQQTDDNVFANANAIGQAWFAASGDAGSRDCGTSVVTVDNPANSPHVIGVGGTTPTCSAGLQPGSAACGGYGSEAAWDGSGGGASQLFARPAFQSGCGVPAGTMRLVPDVALESDTTPGNYVRSGGSWWIVGGTSGAAPQWAGLAALMVQKKGAALGNPGAFLYGQCGTAAFHDVTSGSNGDFTAGAGYDMVTGLGSYDATKLLAAVGGVTTTTTSSSSTSTIAMPTTSTTAPTTSSTTAKSTTTVTTSSSSTTTLGAPCLSAGNLCTTDAQCCSSSCKVKAGVKRCH